jgi:hypothetical protein
VYFVRSYYRDKKVVSVFVRFRALQAYRVKLHTQWTGDVYCLVF